MICKASRVYLVYPSHLNEDRNQCCSPLKRIKIVSYMYAAFQQFMLGVDVGIDLSKEYAAVKGG